MPTAPVPAPTWTSLAPFCTPILASLKVDPCDQLAVSIGSLPNPHSTGGQNSYGWDHKRRLRALAKIEGMERVIHAVLAEEFARPYAYQTDHGQLRWDGYEFAGLPKTPGIMPTAYNQAVFTKGSTVAVYLAYDIQHAWSVLRDAAEICPDDLTITIPMVTGPITVKAKDLLLLRLDLLKPAILGILRDPYYQTPHYGNADNHGMADRLLGVGIWALTMLRLDEEEAEVAKAFIRAVAQNYIDGPGFSWYTRDRTGADEPGIPPGTSYFILPHLSISFVARWKAAQILATVDAPLAALVLQSCAKTASILAVALQAAPGGLTSWVVPVGKTGNGDPFTPLFYPVTKDYAEQFESWNATALDILVRLGFPVEAKRDVAFALLKKYPSESAWAVDADFNEVPL